MGLVRCGCGRRRLGARRSAAGSVDFGFCGVQVQYLHKGLRYVRALPIKILWECFHKVVAYSMNAEAPFWGLCLTPTTADAELQRLQHAPCNGIDIPLPPVNVHSIYERTLLPYLRGLGARFFSIAERCHHQECHPSFAH